MSRVVDTDNFGGDYPNERFLLWEMPEEDAKAICEILNRRSGESAHRYYRRPPARRWPARAAGSRRRTSRARRRSGRTGMPNAKDGNVTPEEFAYALELVVESMSAAELLATPGVYEVLSEALNNEAIKKATEMRDGG